jgi:hypothetical protein
MGAKKLVYNEGQHQSQTTFNYSVNPHLQELAKIFEEISATLEHGRQLEYLHRYDKLGLEAELKRMQDDAKDNQLAELQAVQPVLQKIVADQSIMNISRRRAEQLLAMIRNHPAAEQAVHR